MNEACVVAVYPDLQRVEKAIHILERAGIPTSSVHIVTNELPEKTELIENLRMGDDSLRSGVVGGVLGATVGALAGTAVNVVVGPFSGGLLGGIVGSFIGNMSGWGVHKQRFQHYESLLEQGKVLLLVNGHPLQLIDAERALKETEPEEIHHDAKTSSESAEVNPEEPLKP